MRGRVGVSPRGWVHFSIDISIYMMYDEIKRWFIDIAVVDVSVMRDGWKHSTTARSTSVLHPAVILAN